MKNKIKQTTLWVLSCASLVATIGYSSWIVQSHQEYALKNLDNTSKPVAYIVGNDKVKYTSIEKALEVAKSGDIVCVIPPTTGSVTYEITKNCVISEGVTLVLPVSKSSFEAVQDSKSLDNYINGMVEVPDGPGNCNFASSNNKKIVVTVRSGITITNKGTIVIAGTLTGGNNDAGSIGQTAGDYSELILGQNSKIEQMGSSSAKTYCFGYLNEETIDNGSTVSISSGTIYVPFVVNDYRGFSYSYALSQGGGVSKKGCSAFNRYEFPNVSSRMKVSTSGEVKAIVNILVSFSQANVNNQVSHETLSMVGYSSDCFIKLLSGSTFEYKFNKSTRNADIEITDGCTIGNLAFKASVGSFSADMNTSTAYFPIPYTFSIKLKASSTTKKAIFDSRKQNLKFLPGSKLEVGSNCELKNKSIAIYSAFMDGTNGDGKLFKNSSNATRYPIKPGAMFIMADGSTLSADSIGGTIYCDNSSGISSTSSKTLCNEPWSTSGGLVPSFTEYLEIREEQKIVPSNYINKQKLYFFSNCFANYNKYLPKTKVILGDDTEVEINGIQKVLFAESLTSCKMKFESNVYNALYSLMAEEKMVHEYPYEAKIDNLGKESLFGVVNSTVSISNSSNGVNEFEVQSISVTSTQDKIDGKDPLYVDEDLGLKANIVDSTKVYKPNVVWTTSDKTIATVDSNGIVHGVKLGKVTIFAECNGKKGSYDTEVITEKQTEEITNIWLESQNGKKSNDLKGNANTIGTENNGSNDFSYNEKVNSNTTIKISLKVEPNEGRITGIVWKYKAWAKKSYMEDPNDSQKQINDGTTTIGGTNDTSIKEVKITFTDNTGKSPDSETLSCTVYYGDNQSVNLTFIFDYDKGCILPFSIILMADGSFKRAGLIRTGDLVMSFNHETGKLVANRVIGNDDIDKPAKLYDVVKLKFSNGRETDFVYEHGYFDLSLNKYVYLHETDFKEFIGHDFVFFDDKLNVQKAKLVKGSVNKIFTKLAAPATANHLNLIVDNMLSMEGGLSGLFNIFDYNPKSLAFDKDKMDADIKKYGLLSYKDFKRFFPKEIYDLLPCKYLGVSIGKGLITWEIFEGYVNKWKDQLMENMK